jgi:hypothetical protein
MTMLRGLSYAREARTISASNESAAGLFLMKAAAAQWGNRAYNCRQNEKRKDMMRRNGSMTSDGRTVSERVQEMGLLPSLETEGRPAALARPMI